jgi:tRNA modification GTPase
VTRNLASTVTILTPTGRGAVAVLAVEGPQALELVAKFFRRKGGANPSEWPIDRIHYGAWGTDPSEDVIVCRRTETQIEVHCHGGRVAARRIVDDLQTAGAVEQSWTDWIAAHESSAIRASARQALAQAVSLRTAKILLDQYNGALENTIRDISSALENEKTHPDEVIAKIDALLSLAPVGLHLVQPWRLVIAGAPNVGKSSLLNALVGFERALVYDQSGTTRDVVTVPMALAGWPIEASDTAGWRTSDDPLEAEGVARAREQASGADCLLLVFDQSKPWATAKQELLAAWPQAIVVHNKCDLPAAYRPEDLGGSFVATSTVTGQGIDRLIERIVQHLVPLEPADGAAVPFTIEHVERLQGAAAALRAGDTTTAQAHLLALLAPAVVDAPI